MNFRDTFRVLRKVSVSDGIGGFSDTISLFRSGIKGFVRQLGNEEVIASASKGKKAEYRLYCSDISITISDTLGILRYGDTISEIYEIEAIDQRRDFGSGHKKNMQIDLNLED